MTCRSCYTEASLKPTARTHFSAPNPQDWPGSHTCALGPPLPAANSSPSSTQGGLCEAPRIGTCWAPRAREAGAPCQRPLELQSGPWLLH